MLSPKGFERNLCSTHSRGNEFTKRCGDSGHIRILCPRPAYASAGVGESITAGSEVPYPSQVFSSTGSGPLKNINYRNVGVSIYASMKESDDSPRLDLKLEVSDAVPPEKGSDSPAFRKVVLNCRALLPLGKPTTVGVIEDAGSRHKFQVDVTATKLK